MESKRIDLEEWIRNFYLLKMIYGSRKAREYMERAEYVVACIALASVIVLVFIPVTLVSILKVDWIKRDWASYGVYACMAIIFLLYHFGWKQVKKRWSESTISAEEIDSKTSQVLSNISQLNLSEKEMLQNLVDARGDREAFKQKLEEAFRSINKLDVIEFLQEVENFIRENEAAANQPESKKEERP